MNIFWKFSFLLMTFYVCGVSAADPCGGYTAINDTTMTTAYTASSNKTVTCQNLPALKWYRYTGTTDGLMTNTCPHDLQCGSFNQIWFNDTIPTMQDGEIDKKICVHEGNKCCAVRNDIKTKNCTDYIIYRHTPSQPCTNYCYKAPATNKKGLTHEKSQSGTVSVSIWMLIVAIVTIM